MTQLDASLRLSLVDEVSGSAREIQEQLGAVGQAAESGSSRGGRAMAALSAMEEVAAEEAARLERELSRLRDSGTGSALTMTRLEQSMSRATAQATALRVATSQVETAQGGAARAAAAVTTATTAAATTAGAASRAMAEKIGTVSRLTFALGGLHPQVQQLANAFAHAGHQAYSLAGILPPQLLVFATLAQMVPAVIGVFRRHGEATESVTEATEEGTRSLHERIAAIRGVIEQTERLANLERGLGSRTDQEAALAEAEQSLVEAARARRAASLSAAERARLDAAREETGADSAEAAIEARVARRREAARAAGEVFNEENVRGAEMRRGAELFSLFDRAQREQDATHAEAAARQRRDEMAAALETARAREDEEERFRRVQDAPSAARQRVSDQLVVAGLSDRQRREVERDLGRGRLTDANRRLLGDERAQELLAAQRQVTVAEQQAASARLGRRTFEDDVEGEATTAVAERVRRAFAPPGPAAPPPPPPAREDTTALARFAEDLDRARIRLTIEDQRIRVATSGALEVDASPSSLGGL